MEEPPELERQNPTAHLIKISGRQEHLQRHHAIYDLVNSIPMTFCWSENFNFYAPTTQWKWICFLAWVVRTTQLLAFLAERKLKGNWASTPQSHLPMQESWVCPKIKVPIDVSVKFLASLRSGHLLPTLYFTDRVKTAFQLLFVGLPRNKLTCRWFKVFRLSPHCSS